MAQDRLLDFLTRAEYAALPTQVQEQLHRTVLDTLGAALAGTITPTARIAAQIAAELFPGSSCKIFGTGSTANMAGAALANACAANALDIDDGFRLAKGHPGAVVIPSALAAAELAGRTGAEFLAAVAAGYEVAMRASVIWHGTKAEYHGSGSWGALGAAAAAGILLGLSRQQLWQALGIAEYHAPLAPIMRCVRHPAMVKDGIHWGALVGVTAAKLAQAGFTGIPSILGAPEHRPLIESLGEDWWIHRLYFKPYPCCRWAQPPVAAVLAHRAAKAFQPEEVERIEVCTFRAALALATIHPRTTEEAQYSLPFPVAAAAVRGRLGPDEVAGTGLNDPQILAMTKRVVMAEAPDLEGRFPAEALARVTIYLKDGRTLTAGPLPAPGDAAAPPSTADLTAKFRSLAGPVMPAARVEQVLNFLHALHGTDSLRPLTSLL